LQTRTTDLWRLRSNINTEIVDENNLHERFGRNAAQDVIKFKNPTKNMTLERRIHSFGFKQRQNKYPTKRSTMGEK
jgi:hypothetical protein